MPNLDLNNLTGNDTKAAIATAKIMALMHFPDDDEMQKSYTVVSLANMIVAYGKRKLISQTNLPLALSDFLSSFGGLESLLNAPSLKEMHQITKEVREEALIAGNILYGIHSFNSVNPEAEINNKMSVNKMAFFMKRKYKERKIREFWSKYRCVSHLWASNIYLYQANAVIEALEIPPYHWLYDLLEGAKYYQNFGMEYWPRQKKKTLFTKADLWLIPKTIPEPQSFPPSKKDKWIKRLTKAKVKTVATTPRDSEESKKRAEKWLRKQFKGYAAKKI